MNMKVVAQKAVYHAKKHKYSIVLGAPIIFAIFVNVGTVQSSVNKISVVSSQSPFIMVGDTITLETVVNASKPINAIGGKVLFDKNTLAVTAAATSSIIDLWAHEPTLNQELGEVLFYGGITSKEAFQGTGVVFTFTAKALRNGTTLLSLQNPEMLANDGLGTNILSEKNDLVLHIREKGLPSPDINNDGVITLMDLNIIYFNSLRKYNPRYDLNGDGAVTLSDVHIVLSFLF
jgi:hypothetical protein